MVKRIEKKYSKVKDMTEAERVGLVKEMFAAIPKRYDFLNHFLSLRRDVAWRRCAVKKMLFPRTLRFLDVATGTADLALEAARRYPDIRVTGVDFVREMMVVGQNKIARADMTNNINLLQGDAISLPFSDNVFDVAGIAFGIRNIPGRRRALTEMTRVVVPDGQVIVLEMNFPQHALLQRLYDIYLNNVLPHAARFFSKNLAAYRYLGDSIMNFPAPDVFAGLMAEVGLTRIEKYALTFGITYLYIGRKQNTPF